MSANAAKRQACDIHHCVLMTNPVHLLVTPRQQQDVYKLVLSCYRYIELNPVRTAIVKDPMDYRWSSYPRNAWGRLDLWVTEQREYTALGADRGGLSGIVHGGHGCGTAR